MRVRDQDGRFSLPLLGADAGIATWLVIAFLKFQDLPWPPMAAVVAGIAGAAGLAWACGLHRDWAGRWPRFAGRALLFFCLTTAALHLLPKAAGTALVQGRYVWLAAALLAGMILARAIAWKLREPGAWAPLETLRWILLGTAATWVLWPVYSVRPNGSGDAYWYMMMLSDYLEQMRAGIFPVWLGQTEYAFNGAFSPLRLAPGFQHLGGLLDFLTCHSLSYLAVKNALLAVNTLAAGFSAYFTMRAMLPQRPNFACGLALVYVLSPGVLTPFVYGDQYMTFFAAPYLPLVFYGCWRAFARNDPAAHVILGTGVGALWLCHTPVALWTSLFAAGIYLAKLWLHRHSGRELRLIALALGVYVLLGTYPIVSALALDNVAELPILGLQVVDELKSVFPALFQPIAALGKPGNYQPGYAALLAGAVGIGLALYRRHPPALAFAAATIVLVILMAPTPGLSPWIWSHVPIIILKITNVWVMQRFALLWVALLVFTLAAALAGGGSPRSGSNWLRVAAFLVAVAALAWTGREAERIRGYIPANIPPGSDWEMLYAKPNLVLSRYPYSSFKSAPAYFSHAYMDPRLESRLLDRDKREVLLANADSAASPGPGRTLISEGLLRAFNDNHSTFYLLRPAPVIEAGRHYALRIEFLTQGERGFLQVKGGGLYREYILPDSGMGMGHDAAPRSFGSTPTSSHVVPIYTAGNGPVELRLTNILPDRAITPEFDSARFQLWEYDPGQLAVSVRSLTPYRAEVDSPAPAYLESPRMWLSGYRGIVNGKKGVPVLRSPNNLCMIEVPAGHSAVEIKFAPSLRIDVSYWLAVWSWAGLLALALWHLFRHPAPQP